VVGWTFTDHGARMGRCYEFSELNWLVRAPDRIACNFFKHNATGWWVVGVWVLLMSKAGLRASSTFVTRTHTPMCEVTTSHGKICMTRARVCLSAFMWPNCGQVSSSEVGLRCDVGVYAVTLPSQSPVQAEWKVLHIFELACQHLTTTTHHSWSHTTTSQYVHRYTHNHYQCHCHHHHHQSPTSTSPPQPQP
jgi:hypothetical protein